VIRAERTNRDRSLVTSCTHSNVNPSDLRRTGATMWHMAKPITQRELRNRSGEIMRGLDRGESYLVTRNGVPVGELVPIRRRRFVSVDAVVEAFDGAPAIDLKRFRSDVDAGLDQSITPRG